jgi:hypothetical protein
LFDFLLEDILPVPALPSPSAFQRSQASVAPTSDDVGDPVGLDPAILWHGGAYRLPQASRQDAPAPAAAPVAAERQRYSLHYSRRPRPAPAPAPQPPPAVPPAATPVAASTAPTPQEVPPASSAPQAVAPEPPARETRSRTGSLPPPMQRYGFTATASSLASPLPGSTRAALADANWRAAMAEEYQALVDNGTWRLVPRPPHANVITGKWVFKHKFHADGSYRMDLLRTRSVPVVDG